MFPCVKSYVKILLSAVGGKKTVEIVLVLFLIWSFEVHEENVFLLYNSTGFG